MIVSAEDLFVVKLASVNISIDFMIVFRIDQFSGFKRLEMTAFSVIDPLSKASGLETALWWGSEYAEPRREADSVISVLSLLNSADRSMLDE